VKTLPSPNSRPHDLGPPTPSLPGIGENSALVRGLICEGLERTGVVIDADANAEMTGGRQGLISTPDSRVKARQGRGRGAWAAGRGGPAEGPCATRVGAAVPCLPASPP
jgi:hypothetical protein